MPTWGPYRRGPAHVYAYGVALPQPSLKKNEVDRIAFRLLGSRAGLAGTPTLRGMGRAGRGRAQGDAHQALSSITRFHVLKHA